MAEVSGLFSTANILAARRKYSTSDKLWLAYNDIAKLAFFVRGISSKSVSDPKFRWFEQGLPQSYVVSNASHNDSTTTLTLESTSPLRAGMVLKVISTGEQMRVTAVNSSTQATVQRGWGTTTASSIADDAIIAIIGDANAEGASLPDSLTVEPVEKFNYTQIFREPVKLTETEAATDMYPEGNDAKTKREIALQVHLAKIEKAFLFGEPKEDTATASTPIRATGGVNYFVTTNVTNANGALSQTEFEEFVADAFAKGGNRKLCLVSPLVASAVSYWAGQRLQTIPSDKVFGIDIKEFVTPHGSVKLTTERLLAENSVWNGYAYIIDLDYVGYRYLAGNGINRDTKLRPNRGASGDDLIAEEYLTECGLFLANEEAHSRLIGVTSYA